MVYDARVYEIMIASPGDVQEERKIARGVIHEWNVVHAASRKIVLLPLGWESHSAPEMGDAPQAIINKQVLARADVVVGVFWTRIGTATSEFESGTVEELERHIASGKPAMLYFSSQPVRPDSIEPGQYARLQEFRARVRSKGLHETYDSPSDFREKFYRHLQLRLNQGIFGEGSGDNIGGTSRTPLSEKATKLLRAAGRDANGVILQLRFNGGSSLETGGMNLIDDGGNRREVAAWSAALQELVDQGLASQTDDRGESFELTNAGYAAFDAIDDEAAQQPAAG